MPSNNSAQKQFKGFAIWNVILIVVVVIVAGIVALSFIFPKTPSSVSGPSISSAVPGRENKEAKPLVFDYEPGATTILQGEIKEMTGDKLIVAVSVGENNPALQGRKFQVVWNEKTKIILIESNFLINKKEGQSEVMFVDRNMQEIPDAKKTFLTISDLQIGTNIMVLGADDLKNQDSFTAQEIYKF